MRSRTFALMALPFIAIDYLQLGINTLPTSRNIEMLLDNQEARCKMGALGRKRIEEVLSWDYSKRDLLLVYEMLFPVKTRFLVSDAITLSTRK